MSTPLETTRAGRRAVLAALGGLAVAGRGTRAAARGGRSVRFAFFGADAEQRAYQQLVAAFEAAHPDITIEPAGFDSGDASLRLDTLLSQPDRPWLLRGGPYQSWLWSALASPTAPDVFVLSYQRFPAYAARGILEPLGDHLHSSTALDATDMYPAALDAFRSGDVAGDGLGAIPLNASSLAVYYNADLFAKRGVALPTADWSWEAFASAAEALTFDRDRDGAIGVHGLAIEPRLSRSAAFVWGAGGDLIDDPVQPTRLTLDTPETQNGLRWFAELGPAGRNVTPTSAQAREVNDLARFASGRAAMFVHTRRVVPILREARGLNWDVAPLPLGKAPANVLHSDGLCLHAAARDKEAAWTFIEFAAGPAGQAALAMTGRTVPSLRTIAESDAFLRGTSLPLQFGEKLLGLAPARARVFLDNIPLARRIPAMATLPAVEGMFDSAFKQAFYVDADVQRAATTIAHNVHGMLGDRLTVPSYLFRDGMTEIEE
ncbi:MAG: sugar ABC transporter substrate-binding protein [Chloroflexia bacterium]|nr:sugar ABC transporter substrate-binding protein [Chloroflexia bacterium]